MEGRRDGWRGVREEGMQSRLEGRQEDEDEGGFFFDFLFFFVQGDTGAIKTSMQFLLFFVVAQIKDV